MKSSFTYTHKHANTHYCCVGLHVVIDMPCTRTHLSEGAYSFAYLTSSNTGTGESRGAASPEGSSGVLDGGGGYGSEEIRNEDVISGESVKIRFS